MARDSEGEALAALWRADGPAEWGEDKHVIRYVADAARLAEMHAMVERLEGSASVEVLEAARDFEIETGDGVVLPYRHAFLLLRAQEGRFALEWDLAPEPDECILCFREVEDGAAEEGALELGAPQVATAEMLSRIKGLCGMKGLSLLLRNGEHMTQYVLSGQWRSPQSTTWHVAEGSPPEELRNTAPRGLDGENAALVELNVVFYGKVSSGKSQLVRALLSTVAGKPLPAEDFKIASTGGSTVAARPYSYQQMVLFSDEDKRAEDDGDGDGDEATGGQQRTKARVVFWDTPGIGLKMPTNSKGSTESISFEDIKRGIDEAVDKVDLCVFVFDGDGEEELYGPYVEMVRQIIEKNGYKAGTPEFERAVRRVIPVRTKGDNFIDDWSQEQTLQEQFDKGWDAWPEPLRDLLESVRSRLSDALGRAKLPTVLRREDLCHVSTKAYTPDLAAAPPAAFEKVLRTRTYGLEFLLDKIFSKASSELHLIQLEKHRRKLEDVSSGIKTEIIIGTASGGALGLGVGGLAIGAYSVFEAGMAMAGMSAALGTAATVAVVGLPVLAGAAAGLAASTAYKRRDIKQYVDLSAANKALETEVQKAGVGLAPSTAPAPQPEQQPPGVPEVKATEDRPPTKSK